MTVMQFDKRIVDKAPELFEHIQSSYMSNLVAYMIDSKFRKSVILKEWLEDQVDNPTEAVVKFESEIPDKEDYDDQAVTILRYVKSKIKYVRDGDKWSMPEHWNTADETLTADITTPNGVHYGPMEGDCEDGAVLIYVLCRLKGIPTNRLLILAGDVSGGGHCWIGYKPTEYPLNYVFLDWCYWYKSQSIELRNKFFIDKDSKVHEYNLMNNEMSSSYIKIWFGVNENVSIKNFKYSRDNRRINQ